MRSDIEWDCLGDNRYRKKRSMGSVDQNKKKTEILDDGVHGNVRGYPNFYSHEWLVIGF